MLDIIGLQFDIAWEDPSANSERTLSMVAGLSSAENDRLLILPEMWATGFSMDTAATSASNPRAEAHLHKLAKATQSTTIGGIVSPGEKRARNEALVVGKDGKEIARYQKNRTFRPFHETDHYESGTELAQFESGGFKICPLICYDLRFPELFRRGVKNGAEVFVVIANWPSKRVDHWLALLKARAIENLAYVIGVNRVGNDPNFAFPGKSVVFSPKGELIADAGDREGVLSATLDPTEVTQWRAEFPALEDAE